MTADTPPHPFASPPFAAELWLEIQQLVSRLDAGQALWLSGYLAGRLTEGAPAEQQDSADVRLPGASGGQGSRLLIAYGSETGNSTTLARQLLERMEASGIAADLVDLAGLKVRQLARRERLLLICSTHGDGDPPEPVQGFFESLMEAGAPRLEQLHYAVLALGDSSYERFCETGIQLDERLAALGAQRLAPRQDCDVDYAAPAAAWMERVLALLPQHAGAAAPAAAPMPAAPQLTAHGKPEYSKRQPLAVEVLANVCLSAADREEPIHHLELALETDGFAIAPGDAVGVLAHNAPDLVALLLDATGLSGEQPVVCEGEAMPLVQALRTRCDLTIPSKRFVEAWAALTGSTELAQQAAADAKTQRTWLRGQQIRDLVSRHPARPEAQALVDALRPLQPRLYDVANSLAVTPDELHLTVKHYRYDFNGRTETGVASDYLVQLQPGESVLIYPHHNKRFHLPDASDVPVILIGDGTGIAPYRAFVQELGCRNAIQEPGGRSAANPCWLAFAEQRFEEDFLYQLDWQAAHRDGLLQRLDTAFFRDQPGHTLAGALAPAVTQLVEWLQRGAHLYFCGDKELLTHCEEELRQLVDDTAAGALSWKQLDSAKRIHRNLY